jgi:RecA-family ATPase
MRTTDEARREFDKIVPLKPGDGKPKANGEADANEGQTPEAEDPEDFKPIRFGELAGSTPPPRRFIIDQWLPAGCVTSLYGPGGIGKSLLVQQAGTAISTGRPFFGAKVEKGPVLGFMAEDDNDELWRRQIRINEWAACDMADVDANLLLHGRVGMDNTFVVYPSTGVPSIQPFHERVRKAALIYKPVVIILDPIAQIFGGDENNRFQVTHFVNVMTGLAREFNCAVLMPGHPAKSEDSEYSGNTAWNATVRSRLLLQRRKGSDDGELLLSRVKSNYAQPDSLSLRWVNGVLRPTAEQFMSYGDRLDVQMRMGAAKQAFLDALDRLTGNGRNVSDSTRAGNYAPKVMIEAGFVDGFTKGELATAMNGLFAEFAIKANEPFGRGPDRHKLKGIAKAQVTP